MKVGKSFLLIGLAAFMLAGCNVSVMTNTDPETSLAASEQSDKEAATPDSSEVETQENMPEEQETLKDILENDSFYVQQGTYRELDTMKLYMTGQWYSIRNEV
ncbi:MAG: hypothetical protein K6E62_09520 [Lachnospiraceae bacterium]|nr:hypothetical protein [Lachnospiraceae bacterium]